MALHEEPVEDRLRNYASFIETLIAECDSTMKEIGDRKYFEGQERLISSTGNRLNGHVKLRDRFYQLFPEAKKK